MSKLQALSRRERENARPRRNKLTIW